MAATVGSIRVVENAGNVGNAGSVENVAIPH